MWRVCGASLWSIVAALPAQEPAQLPVVDLRIVLDVAGERVPREPDGAVAAGDTRLVGHRCHFTVGPIRHDDVDRAIATLAARQRRLGGGPIRTRIQPDLGVTIGDVARTMDALAAAGFDDLAILWPRRTVEVPGEDGELPEVLEVPAVERSVGLRRLAPSADRSGLPPPVARAGDGPGAELPGSVLALDEDGTFRFAGTTFRDPARDGVSVDADDDFAALVAAARSRALRDAGERPRDGAPPVIRLVVDADRDAEVVWLRGLAKVLDQDVRTDWRLELGVVAEDVEQLDRAGRRSPR